MDDVLASSAPQPATPLSRAQQIAAALAFTGYD